MDRADIRTAGTHDCRREQGVRVRYPSPERFIEVFRAFYGPVHKAFLALDPDGQSALAGDLLDTIARFNTATDGSMRAPSDYAEVIIVKA